MKYLLMLYADEIAGDAVPPAEMAKWIDKMHAYQEALSEAGAFVSTAGLARSHEATTVHLDHGEMKVRNGPYAETRDQLGGFYIRGARHGSRAALGGAVPGGSVGQDRGPSLRALRATLKASPRRVYRSRGR